MADQWASGICLFPAPRNEGYKHAWPCPVTCIDRDPNTGCHACEASNFLLLLPSPKWNFNCYNLAWINRDFRNKAEILKLAQWSESKTRELTSDVFLLQPKPWSGILTCQEPKTNKSSPLPQRAEMDRAPRLPYHRLTGPEAPCHLCYHRQQEQICWSVTVSARLTHQTFTPWF